MTHNPRQNPKPRLMTNEELARVLASRDGAGFTTMLHPLELFMPRELLESLTQTSLEAVRMRPLDKETDIERRAAETAIQQRIDFLGWLQGQPDNIYMALYPADMDGLDELGDLEDLLGDEDPQRDLPF
jgi:hypothetical protein